MLESVAVILCIRHRSLAPVKWTITALVERANKRNLNTDVIHAAARRGGPQSSGTQQRPKRHCRQSKRNVNRALTPRSTADRPCAAPVGGGGGGDQHTGSDLEIAGRVDRSDCSNYDRSSSFLIYASALGFYSILLHVDIY
uniref:Uncharacterized protein n=1 Tax=Plectus sambesii TaxID=2011161 RepID=A0A914WGF8_9BILA